MLEEIANLLPEEESSGYKFAREENKVTSNTEITTDVVLERCQDINILVEGTVKKEK